MLGSITFLFCAFPYKTKTQCIPGKRSAVGFLTRAADVDNNDRAGKNNAKLPRRHNLVHGGK